MTYQNDNCEVDINLTIDNVIERQIEKIKVDLYVGRYDKARTRILELESFAVHPMILLAGGCLK